MLLLMLSLKLIVMVLVVLVVGAAVAVMTLQPSKRSRRSTRTGKVVMRHDSPASDGHCSGCGVVVVAVGRQQRGHSSVNQRPVTMMQDPPVPPHAQQDCLNTVTDFRYCCVLDHHLLLLCCWEIAFSVAFVGESE